MELHRGIIRTVAAWLLLMPHIASAGPEEDLLALYRADAVFSNVPEALFNQQRIDLPDDGATVKALADAAPGGAFDPRRLESLSADKLGYRARWIEHRYKVYGLDWDIGGLLLTPNRAVAGLPTLVIIHGGSSNWYEFYVDFFNNPGLGQFLAQKVPVLLLTIPGNYKHGGWTENSYGERVPAYLLDRELTPQEGRVRNAIYTFRVVVDGVRGIIEKSSSGPVVVVGHSTGGEIPFLLADTPLKSRMNGQFMGWGSGGPARLDKILSTPEEHRESNLRRYSQYAPVQTLRARSAGETAYESVYIGPLNPCKGSTKLEVATCWFRQEERRRPSFKQKLQDLEHAGADLLIEATAMEIRAALKAGNSTVNPQEVVADLFLTNRAPLGGYKKMIWLIGKLDGHARIENGIPSEAYIANEFRKANPGIPIRVALLDLPVTHYAHVERPQQLAAAMLTALKWLQEK